MADELEVVPIVSVTTGNSQTEVTTFKGHVMNVAPLLSEITGIWGKQK